MVWTNETRIKNAQVNGADWIDLRATELTWNQEVSVNIPTTPMKSGIPAVEADWLGVDNPAITVRGLLDYSHEQGSVITFPFLERLATATGPSFFIDAKLTSGNNPFHIGSIAVFIRSFAVNHVADSPLTYPYTLSLVSTSGV